MKSKYANRVLKASILAASFFITNIFISAEIVMKTTEGYSFSIMNTSLFFSITLNGISFVGGILSLIIMIGMYGWIKSKKREIHTAFSVNKIIIIKLLDNLNEGISTPKVYQM